MYSKLKNNKGNSSIELLMVMLFFILFGVTIYALIVSGSIAQKKIMDEKDAQVNARIALSYLSVKLRQYDKEGCVDILENPVSGENFIVLRDRDIMNEEFNHDTWIGFVNGSLVEYIVNPDEIPIVNETPNFEIVEIKNFKTGIEKSGAIKNVVEYEYNDKKEVLTGIISLRSVR